jgi:hypothetical protein
MRFQAAGEGNAERLTAENADANIVIGSPIRSI